jgi:signal transduction histidine kinase
MVGQVLDLARMNSDGGAGKTAYEAVSVRSVLEQAVAQARWLPESNAVQIETEIEEALPQVHGDPQALVRAIQNLVTNAIRYGAKGQWVGVRAARESGFVRIEVRDRGPGIDMADAEHLFDPFYRGRGTSTVRGSGLGLTIVQQIVVEHGGSVSVQRNSDNGATFLVRLPAGVTRG